MTEVYLIDVAGAIEALQRFIDGEEDVPPTRAQAALDAVKEALENAAKNSQSLAELAQGVPCCARSSLTCASGT